jgi:hypothetical protein
MTNKHRNSSLNRGEHQMANLLRSSPLTIEIQARGGRSRLSVPCVILWTALVAGLPGCDQEVGRWDESEVTHTVEAYEGFLAQYPDSPHRAAATAAIEELEWTEVQGRGTVDGYADFMGRYPASAHRGTAEKAAEDVAWNALSTVTDSGPLIDFVARYPASSRRAEAKSKIEQIEWELVSDNSLAEVQAFRLSHPASRFEDAAQERAFRLALRASEENLREASILAEGETAESLLALVTVTEGVDEDGRSFTERSVAGSRSGLDHRDLLLQEVCWLTHPRPYHIESIHVADGEEPSGLYSMLGGGDTPLDLEGVAGRRANHRGSITMSQTSTQLLLVGASFQIPEDVKPFGSVRIPIISMGDRSVFRIIGKVDGLFPPITFESTADEPLAFMLVAGKGLTYLSGYGTVTLEPGAEPIKFPEAVGGDGKSVDRISAIFEKPILR